MKRLLFTFILLLALPIFVEAQTYKVTISGNNGTTSYVLVDCGDTAAQVGVRVTGTGNTLLNYTVVRCPGGAFQFDESATLKNSIGISTGDDITIATSKTVTSLNNLFGDSAKAGAGTYSDTGSTTKWSSNPLFVSATDYHLTSSSPAINAGQVVVGLHDQAGCVDYEATTCYNVKYPYPDIGAYAYTKKPIAKLGTGPAFTLGVGAGIQGP